MITLGGDAELELVDSLDPFSEVGAADGLESGSRVLTTSSVLLYQPTVTCDLDMSKCRSGDQHRPGDAACLQQGFRLCVLCGQAHGSIA